MLAKGMKSEDIKALLDAEEVRFFEIVSKKYPQISYEDVTEFLEEKM